MPVRSSRAVVTWCTRSFKLGAVFPNTTPFPLATYTRFHVACLRPPRSCFLLPISLSVPLELEPPVSLRPTRPFTLCGSATRDKLNFRSCRVLFWGPRENRDAEGEGEEEEEREKGWGGGGGERGGWSGLGAAADVEMILIEI